MVERIAVVGAGVAGIVAAYLLAQKHQVTLFESNRTLGGHTNTRVIQNGPDQGTAIDTGFIVCNARNYSNFYSFLNRLQVKLQDSEMSFGFSCERTRRVYLGPSLSEFVRVPENLFKPSLLRLFFEQAKFNRAVLRDLKAGVIQEQPLAEYIKTIGVSPSFVSDYITPLIAAIWSSPDQAAGEFPAETFATFFQNHGMLQLNTRPVWQTVVGGSHSYLKAFEQMFKGTIRTNCAVQKIERDAQHVILDLNSGERQQFDKVVIAAHADQVLHMVNQPSNQELQAFSGWRYSQNHAVLHTDRGVMPPQRRMWASWNYRRRKAAEQQSPVNVTYYMNRLQNLKTKADYFVSLNSAEAIDSSKVIYEVEYTHPCYTAESRQRQVLTKALNGSHRTYYCGAYLGYGFHEDAVKSAQEVARHFGLEL